MSRARVTVSRILVGLLACVLIASLMPMPAMAEAAVEIGVAGQSDYTQSHVEDIGEVEQENSDFETLPEVESDVVGVEGEIVEETDESAAFGSDGLVDSPVEITDEPSSTEAQLEVAAQDEGIVEVTEPEEVLSSDQTSGKHTIATDATSSKKNSSIEGTSQTVHTTGLTAQASKKPNVYYRVHRQTYGWESGWVKNGQTSGTTGQSKRLEGIYIKVGNLPVSGSIKYRTHVQTYGWQGWKTAGKLAGTTGKSKRLEAIQIKLTGKLADKYDVWYRVHAQQFGWMGWAKNGGKAGTEGYSYRLEAIQIRLMYKESDGPGSTANAFRKYVPPAISQDYVGTYSQRYIVSEDTPSYAGTIHAGSMYAQRTLVVRSISGNKVTFRVTYVNPYAAAGEATTGWITAAVNNGRCDFSYVGSANYGGETGTGYLKFGAGRITMKLTSTHIPRPGRVLLGMSTELILSKGTYDVWV